MNKADSATPPKSAHRIYLELSTAAVALLFLAYQLYPLLMGVEPAGWDLTGHLYAFREILNNLSHGRIRGYDFLWGGGYPAFFLYPVPGAYLIMAIPRLLSFGALSEIYSFDLTIVAAAVATLGACFYLGVAIFGRAGGPPAVLLGSFMLATPPDYDFFGIGLAGCLSAGMLANFIVLPFFILFIAFLERHKQTGKFLHLALAALCLFCVFEIHTLTFLFSLFIWATYLVFAARKERLALIGALVAVLAACLPTLIPLIRHLPYSQGSPVGLWGDYADPLFPLLSGLTPSRLWTCIVLLLGMVPQPMASIAVRIPVMLTYFPYAGILILLSVGAGLIALVNEKRLLIPACYIAALIFIPRNFFSSDLPLAIHYYRFVQPLFVLQIIIGAKGLLQLGQGVMARKGFVRTGALVFTALAIIVTDFLSFSLTRKSLLTGVKIQPYRSEYTIDASQYPGRAAADELMQYLDSLHPTGRVAVETSQASYYSLGSPYFFSAELPLRYKIPTIPGLFTQSTLSSAFIDPLLMPQGERFHWDGADDASKEDLASQSFASRIARLRLFGVQIIVTTSHGYFKAMSDPEMADTAKLVRTFGPLGSVEFGLFELIKPRPLAETLHSGPYLYVSRDPKSFLEFSQRWFTDPDLSDDPVIYTPKSLGSIDASDLGSIGGFIFEAKAAASIDYSEVELLQKLGKPIIIINARVAPTAKLPPNIRMLPSLPGFAGAEAVRQAIISFYPETPAPPQPLDIKFGDGELNFEGKGASLIRVSYGPEWKVENSSRTVFWATPSSILIFGKGDTRLRYGN